MLPSGAVTGRSILLRFEAISVLFFYSSGAFVWVFFSPIIGVIQCVKCWSQLFSLRMTTAKLDSIIASPVATIHNTYL